MLWCEQDGFSARICSLEVSRKRLQRSGHDNNSLCRSQTINVHHRFSFMVVDAGRLQGPDRRHRSGTAWDRASDDRTSCLTLSESALLMCQSSAQLRIRKKRLIIIALNLLSVQLNARVSGALDTEKQFKAS